ncbi:MAG: EF-P beta-lysylation protein EpmB [Legionellales bacterium]|nr:EF-P beta-lysylation protein EpmB [Legionellales bacterium]
MRDPIPCWQKNLAEGFSSSTELLHHLQLSASMANADAQKQFKTRVPRGFVARMKIGDRYDPLLLQVLPVTEELVVTEGFVTDPLSEATYNPKNGLIQKYHGRVLLTFTGACAIHCRYCFRRYFPYVDNNPGREGWREVLDYIAKDSAIHEVILSGGDPLLAKDAMLSELLVSLDEIPHLRTLRIHTRLPVVLPERVNDSLIKVFLESRLQKVVVLHSNHPQELDATVEIACQTLRKAGCHVLNQTVLLAGINDNAGILVELSERLFSFGVLPYYLHLLDKVQGTAHFEVQTEHALDIFHQLQRLLPGYLVPKLVREEAGSPHKTLVI